jgi:biopolymer transport protein ExbD
MDNLDSGDSAGYSGRHRKLRAKRDSTRVDMTPMVDLAFLLLTFFVLTSTFIKPAVMEITMPVKGPPGPVKNILTLLLDESDTIHYYYGMPDSVSPAPFQATGYGSNGIRKVLITYNKAEFEKVNKLEKELMLNGSMDEDTRRKALEKGISEITAVPGTLTVVVKTCENTKYERVIDVLDELNIAFISRKAILDISPQEEMLLDAMRSNR